MITRAASASSAKAYREPIGPSISGMSGRWNGTLDSHISMGIRCFLLQRTATTTAGICPSDATRTMI